MLSKYIGNRSFYKTVFNLAVPIMIQNAITNFVSMLDNIMVGREGTNAFSGVGIANQLIFVFTVLMIGVGAGASIFGAQFFGKGDIEGIRYSFRFKIIVGVVITLISMAIFYFFGNPLIRLYLRSENNSSQDIAEILKSGKEYLNIMLIGLIPYSISQAYAGTLRECNRTVLPMSAGMIAVFVNLIFNYFLIFGKCGFPRLSVNGASIATVISRFSEMAVLIIATRVTAQKSRFIIGAWRSMKIPSKLLGEMYKKGIPLMINEVMWAAGIAVMNLCYSTRGIDAVAANNITQTYFNVFSVAFSAVGISIGLILGQQLGKGDISTIKDTCRKLIAFSIMISIVISLVFFVCAYAIPMLYNTTSAVKITARHLMQICAVLMPLEALAQALYFTLRSGGKTLMLFVFDTVFTWIISVPAAILLANFTGLPIAYMYVICQGLIIIKCIFGYIFVKKGTWIRNVISDV